MTGQATGASARPRTAIIVLGVAVAALGLGATSWLVMEKPGPASDARPASSNLISSYPIPSFARPEEARRYFDAMIQGDKRAIEVIDTALAKAKQQPGVDAAYVQKLEKLRVERATRLAAHVAAQRDDGAAPR